MKKYLRNIVLVLMFGLMLPLLVPTTRALADCGPHESVEVKVEGIEGQPYYVTLLSKDSDLGRWNYKQGYDDWMGPKEIWQKFMDYKDVDGYYFLGIFDECSKTNNYDWSYYPPDEFKILIYLPNQDQMICSKESYTRYAFHTYYTVKLSESDILLEGSKGEEAEDWPDYRHYPIIYGQNHEIQQISITYDMNHEIIAFVFRVVLTVLIELAVAWFFSFRNKRQIMIIVITNILTQSALNLLLNLMDLQKGPWGYRLYYFALECLVFVIEGFVYQKLLVADETGTAAKRKAWLYALAANVASFVVGVIISIFLPRMF